MTLISRSTTESDLRTIQELANSHMLTLNPREKSLSEIEARELLEGFHDPAITRLIRSEEDQEWQSFITLNPDSSRRRMYLDIYTRPGSSILSQSLSIALELARQAHPDFRLWLGVLAQDVKLIAALEVQGFELLRRYFLMEMALPAIETLPSKDLQEIREIDFTVDLEIFHEVHQDAFSKHFGFVPRGFEEWRNLILRDHREKNLRAWMISVDGVDAGFVDYDASLSHENTGYVSGLGVRQSFQGQGLGEALLSHAIKENSKMGYSHLCLNVDAGNESGALRLYEKVGLRPISETHHYENLRWSAL